MYNSKYLDPELSPRCLRNKVEMDLRYYFVRRGCENIYHWTKDTFKLVKDATTDIVYVEKVEDEETKNHKETNNEIITAFMPEIKGSRMCPVMSFTTYLSALSPNTPYLWQSLKYEKFNFATKVWYGPGRIGQNTLDSFITKLAKNIGLEEKRYTNHSLRVSGIINLTRNKFSNKQIMSISGHKSQESLAIYQKVNANEKLRMGMTLRYTLNNMPCQQVTVAPAQIQQESEPPAKKQKITYEVEDPIPSNNNALAIPDNQQMNKNMDDDFEISDQELLSIINETAEVETMEMTQYNEVKTSTNGNNKTMLKQVVQKRNSPRVLIFNNCHFGGNVTMNINELLNEFCKTKMS